jgi:hypothetical protein
MYSQYWNVPFCFNTYREGSFTVSRLLAQYTVTHCKNNLCAVLSTLTKIFAHNFFHSAMTFFMLRDQPAYL